MDWITIAALIGGIGTTLQGAYWAIKQLTREDEGHLVLNVQPAPILMDSVTVKGGSHVVTVQWVGAGNCWDIALGRVQGFEVVKDQPLSCTYLASGDMFCIHGTPQAKNWEVEFLYRLPGRFFYNSGTLQGNQLAVHSQRVWKLHRGVNHARLAPPSQQTEQPNESD